MNKLGYCHLVDGRNEEDLYSLNSSIENLMKTELVLANFKKIEFKIEGLYLDGNLRLICDFTTKNDTTGTKIFSTHVDESSISVNKDFIVAHYGFEKLEELEAVLEENFLILEADYLKQFEPDLFNQLAESYLLDCSPNTENGAEFTEEDKKFFSNECEVTLYDAVVELNEYIEKFSEIQPQLDEICEKITNERVRVINDGCSDYILRKVIGYLENHGIIVKFN